MVYLLPTPYVVGKVENTAKNDRGLTDFPKLGIQPAFDRITFQADSSNLFCQNTPSSRCLLLLINIENNFSRYKTRGPELCLLMFIPKIGLSRPISRQVAT